MSRVVRRKHVLLRDSDEETEHVAAPLERLGAELLEHALAFLTHREAAGARMTCRALREVSVPTPRDFLTGVWGQKPKQ